MFHLCEQYFVSAREILMPPGPDHEIYRLGSAAGENDFLSMSGIDKFLNFIPRVLIQICCFSGKLIYGSVYVGIVPRVKIRNRPEHCGGLLRCRGIVQVDQLVAVDSAVKNGKFFFEHGHEGSLSTLLTFGYIVC